MRRLIHATCLSAVALQFLTSHMWQQPVEENMPSCTAHAAALHRLHRTSSWLDACYTITHALTESTMPACRTAQRKLASPCPSLFLTRANWCNPFCSIPALYAACNRFLYILQLSSLSFTLMSSSLVRCLAQTARCHLQPQRALLGQSVAALGVSVFSLTRAGSLGSTQASTSDPSW